MVEIKRYDLKPTSRIPNSSFPLIHYRGLLPEKAEKIYEMFNGNGWEPNWIFRYGQTQQSHYHSRAHECMAVLTGNATIRFGAADLSSDLNESTWGSSWEKDSYVEVQASAGDVFIIPAGVAHKTYDTKPEAPFALLTPGSGRGIEAEDPRKALSEIDLSGFTMLGAYPKGGQWDFAVGNTDHSDWQNTWSIPRPEKDPVLGEDVKGLCGLWDSR